MQKSFLHTELRTRLPKTITTTINQSALFEVAVGKRPLVLSAGELYFGDLVCCLALSIDAFRLTGRQRRINIKVDAIFHSQST